ncbi:histone deacetylase [Penicillium chermesinum]|nr:histone deacetylase [Penicillium chermesinum]
MSRKMDDDEDVVMGEPRKLSLPSHNNYLAGLTTQQTVNSHGSDPILTPSLLPSIVKSPSSGDNSVHGGKGLPEGVVKLSDSESTSAEHYLPSNDSVIEQNSDWSDEEETDSGLPLGSMATGLCYDVRMRYHCEVRPLSDLHPEDPRRIYFIYKELCKAGLVDDPDSTRPLAPQTLQRIPIRSATQEEIRLIHSEPHWEFIESTQRMSDDTLVELEHSRDSIYFNRLTFDASLLSTGGAIETCLAVAERKVKNAIAVIRPPGHHAEDDAAMGFCIFNNVSVAARVCQNKLGDSCRKIMILDWDVHHGNGIQKAFYEDPNILYISIHVHAGGKFYPGGDAGNWDHCGAGPGVGRNVNIPWPDHGMGDGDYMFAFQTVVMPIAQEFNPDLVIIAAGFDAAAGDLLGGCFVTPACYAQMTHMLMVLANGKLAVCLEGGYNFRSISKSALAVTKTLMGEPPDRLLACSPSEAAVDTVRRVKSIQAHHWHCMFPKPSQHPAYATQLHDMIRDIQAKQLYDKFKLTPLHIYRTGLSKSFTNMVLASPNFHEDVPTIIIFHDPPEIIGMPHPVTSKIEAHNCWLADALKDYIQWVLDQDTESARPQYIEEDEDRPHATEELAAYLWDNYIAPRNGKEIIFIGIGSAFHGVTQLLMQRENLYHRIDSLISFVAQNPVRAVSSTTQTWLSKWYHDNSLVFISHNHGVWDRKPSKRYGTLRQSPKTDLNEMLADHKEEVFQYITDRIHVETDETEEEAEEADTEMNQ